MPRRLGIDVKMLAGFGGLLFLIIAVGLIGIQQIQGLTRTIAVLARSDMPMQNAVLEMKSSNSQYAMGIRSYMFYKSARYLDEAAVTEKLNLMRRASENFDRHMSVYASLAETAAEKEWIQKVRIRRDELRRLSAKIIRLINQWNDGAPALAQRPLEESLKRELMDFENRLFQIDAFLDDPLQRFNFQKIDRRLNVAEAGRRRSLAFLAWSIVVGLGIGTQTAFLIYRWNKRERDHKEMLCRTMIQVEEEQKNNLSLQVHDQMGQDLSALKIFLGLIERDIAAGAPETSEKIGKAKKIVDGLMEKTHNISEILRPPELDDVGLIESIATLLMRHAEITGVATNYVRPPTDMKLAPEYSLILYRVVQEALTNIAKHSKAGRVEVTLENKERRVFLSVADDGSGFDVADILRRPARRHEDKVRLGLRGLRERLELLGGAMNISSGPGLGTRLEVVLPIV